ncbi:LSM domain-containing protein [Stachybotrys elegans]|uniref:LSM domain-containing protein n=1 Tax=Stachybotrys elegans TaxID=80388 RepID=A0A8K0SY47_9HYPO|nr:LSM domain-containing protein [Stachybotrys elegans]
MDKEEAREYLASLLNHNLRVLATDGRLFVGSLKCTDPDQNIVLAHTYEYRQPSAERQAEEAEKADKASRGTFTLDMTSRYLGLVVIPGQHIVKMEVEKFASQMKAH